ncbi:MAG: aldose 1-epimerase family protein [Trueperaceae bacterium]|nr:MAG: aldose 1-epimerase family protein [Trueperaceae bacterium]
MAEIFGRNWTRRELLARVGHMDQLAGIRASTAGDGTARGGRLFDVTTGSGLSFRVLADRALDITSCSYRGTPLAWNSPSGEVHPSYYEAAGMGWLRSFPGGLVTTCGLDQFGAPSFDAGEDFGIHGRLSNLPAEQVSHRAEWRGDEYQLEIRGRVRQARLFGENLVLERCITTRLGSNRILLEDTVCNEGFEPQPHMLLYHCNLGFPLVSEETRLAFEAETTLPRDADAEPGLAAWHRFQAPTTGYREQVFRHVAKADEKGMVAVTVHNPGLEFDLVIRYPKAALPHLFQWKMMGQGAYVLGIEPANSSGIGGRAAARESGDLPQLEPGESRKYQLLFDIVERR